MVKDIDEHPDKGNVGRFVGTGTELPCPLQVGYLSCHLHMFVNLRAL